MDSLKGNYSVEEKKRPRKPVEIGIFYDGDDMNSRNFACHELDYCRENRGRKNVLL